MNRADLPILLEKKIIFPLYNFIKAYYRQFHRIDIKKMFCVLFETKTEDLINTEIRVPFVVF